MSYSLTQKFGVKCLTYSPISSQHELGLRGCKWRIAKHLKERYGKKFLKFIKFILYLFRLASFSLTFNFLFYLNMEEFLLTREPLDIVRISTALFVRVEQGEWTGILEKEVKNP